jgi:hypothetical protein
MSDDPALLLEALERSELFAAGSLFAMAFMGLARP